MNTHVRVDKAPVLFTFHALFFVLLSFSLCFYLPCVCRGQQESLQPRSPLLGNTTNTHTLAQTHTHTLGEDARRRAWRLQSVIMKSGDSQGCARA